MKNINDKTKKGLVIVSGLIITVILIVLIVRELEQKPIEDAVVPNENIETEDVIVTKPVIEEKEDKGGEGEVIVPPIEVDDTEMVDKHVIDIEVVDKDKIDKDTTDKSTSDTVIEQTIQADVEKPKEPAKEQLTDPTQKPSGEKLETPPEPVEHDKVEKPKEVPPNNDEPQGGDTKNGKIYVPGFGWIDDVGEGAGAVVDGDGDINKQIGIMD